MNYVVIVSHGNLASGLHNTLEMFVSDNGQLKSIGLKSGEDVDSFASRADKLIEEFNPEDHIILLADLIGGSPLTTFMNCLGKKNLLANTKVMGGVNLAMGLNAVLMKDSFDMVCDMALKEARESVKELEINISNDEEDI